MAPHQRKRAKSAKPRSATRASSAATSAQPESDEKGTVSLDITVGLAGGSIRRRIEKRQLKPASKRRFHILLIAHIFKQEAAAESAAVAADECEYESLDEEKDEMEEQGAAADEGIVAGLVAMGFDRGLGVRAALATGNSSVRCGG